MDKLRNTLTRKPCPLCGSKNIQKTKFYDEDPDHVGVISCQDCNLRLQSNDVENAWNMRAGK